MVMLTSNQELMLSELAKTYQTFSKDPNWPKSRPTDGGMGGFIIDKISQDPAALDNLLKAMANAAIKGDRESKNFSNATNCAKLLTQLSANDPDFAKALNNALDTASQNQFKENPNSLLDIVKKKLKETTILQKISLKKIGKKGFNEQGA